MSVRVVCLSDTHDHHDDLLSRVPMGDILIHAGDFSNFGDIEEVKRFNEFLRRLPHRHKVVVAGNHEISFDANVYDSLWQRFHKVKYDCQVVKSTLTECIYLEDELVELEGLRIYGSPWQPSRLPAAFTKPWGELKPIWDKIPCDLDILITHGPPANCLDEPVPARHVGCRHLLEAVQRVQPRYHIFGHIHQAYGTMRTGNTTFINAAICNAGFELANAPIVIDIKPTKTVDKTVNSTV
eukprot:GILJ01006080.1.p1 GENE.GILJ01006080.1~~GILJ01006080.1.p1  ORF type:complete len:239 (-),score=14.09 GILJ01006080.1:181-897(-)